MHQQLFSAQLIAFVPTAIQSPLQESQKISLAVKTVILAELIEIDQLRAALAAARPLLWSGHAIRLQIPFFCLGFHQTHLRNVIRERGKWEIIWVFLFLDWRIKYLSEMLYEEKVDVIREVCRYSIKWKLKTFFYISHLKINSCWLRSRYFQPQFPTYLLRFF